MRGIRSTGLGIAVGLFGPTAMAQEIVPVTAVAPTATRTPAAKFGRIQAIGSPDVGVVVARGQAADGAPPNPMPPGIAPPGGTTLGMPRQIPTGPSVTEHRDGYPGATLGMPPGLPPGAKFGVPIPVGPPVAVGQPYEVSPPSGQLPGHPDGMYPQGVPFGDGSYPGMTSGPIASSPVAAPAGPLALPSLLPGGGGCATGSCAAPFLEDPLFAGVANGMVAAPSSRPRLGLYGEVLLGWIPNFNTPALLTTSRAADNGILGRRSTQVVLGGKSLHDEFHTGGKFGGVYWLGDQKRWGIGGDFWFLGKNTGSFLASSNNFPVLARPFVNLNQNTQFSELIAFPDFSVGTGLVTTSSEAWGGGFDILRNVACTPCSSLNFLTGFRYMRLNESLSIQESFAREDGAATTPGLQAVDRGTVTDSFETSNDFYGANFGLTGEMRRGRFFVSGRAAIAVGETFQTLNINGSQTIQYSDGSVGVVPGGLLALPGANIGTFNRREFAVMPELGIKVGMYVTPHLKVTVGYNMMYLSNVLRPGDQIDQGLDVARIPNFPLIPPATPLITTRPIVPMDTSSILIQGVTLGMQYDFY